MLASYISAHSEFEMYDCYADDGCTGTNFDRPSFQRMMKDAQAGKIDCIIVKDLSRFGRDYIDAGRYLERLLPQMGVRFISLNDGIDSERGAYDMMLPMKNLFNAQYAKDISVKVKSAVHVKQARGEFVGAFASYGYMKDPKNHNHLVIDPVASETVRRIFDMFEQGTGKIRIAKILNAEGVPCPSSYKHLMGDKYCNNHRLESTDYWTYATVHRILKNEMYIGNMEQGRDTRAQLHGKAKRKDRSDWVIVEGTHEAIIGREQWDRVQAIINCNARPAALSETVSPFAGLLRCGDCGRAMARTVNRGEASYTCGSFKRYGRTACTRHYIREKELEFVVLGDLNAIISDIGDLRAAAEKNCGGEIAPDRTKSEKDRLTAALERVRRMKQGAYEDYREKIIAKDDFIRYRDDYEGQENIIAERLAALNEDDVPENILDRPWVRSLLETGRLSELDRRTLLAAVREIRIFEGGRAEITYKFSPG